MKIRPINANDLEQFAYCTEPATWDNPYGGDYVVKMEDIEKLPTLDWAPIKHRRWVMKETMIRSLYAKNAYCSECLEETSYHHNYCPNCGAKMDLEEEV